MPITMCVCGQGEIEWMDQYCQMCWESYCAEGWWQMIKGIGWDHHQPNKYRKAIAAARAAHPDFDTLQPSWGL